MHHGYKYFFFQSFLLSIYLETIQWSKWIAFLADLQVSSGIKRMPIYITKVKIVIHLPSSHISSLQAPPSVAIPFSVDLLQAAQPSQPVVQESQLSSLQIPDLIFPKVRSHSVPLHWGPTVSFLLKSRRNGWKSYEHLQARSMRKVIPPAPWQRLQSLEQREQHGQHRCAAAQRREC